MKSLPIEKETVLVRVNGIQGELNELFTLARVPFKDFSDGSPFKLSQYHLHRALEGVFHIASHIISRFPGGKEAGTYKDMARFLGQKGIVDPAFSNMELCKMAGYRNRLVHFYAEITTQELYDILQNHLKDIETFLKAIKAVLENPKKFGLKTI